MGRARPIRRHPSGARLPATAPAEEPADAHALARLSQMVGNRAVAQMLARTPTGAPVITDRSRIDDLAKKTVTATERCKAYAEIAGTQSVQMDPATVHVSTFYKDGVNLDALKQARDVGATTGFIDDSNQFTGGAPPENVKGVAIVVNSNAWRFEDEDYMVAAIRHEMVHARLMRLTLQHRDAWKQNPKGLSFSQYVDKQVGGTDGALIKDRFFGGHMDETVAYAEGFLTAFFYGAIEEPAAGDRSWIPHLKGFTKEFETAKVNSRPLPKDRSKIPEAALATNESATAVGPETEKLVKEYCDAGGDAHRKNLAAWMQYVYKKDGFYDAAIKMIYKVATKGKTPAEPKRP